MESFLKYSCNSFTGKLDNLRLEMTKRVLACVPQFLMSRKDDLDKSVCESQCWWSKYNVGTAGTRHR